MITEANMLKYLGEIEKRAKEIIDMYKLCNSKVRG